MINAYHQLVTWKLQQNRTIPYSWDVLMPGSSKSRTWAAEQHVQNMEKIYIGLEMLLTYKHGLRAYNGPRYLHYCKSLGHGIVLHDMEEPGIHSQFRQYRSGVEVVIMSGCHWKILGSYWHVLLLVDFMDFMNRVYTVYCLLNHISLKLTYFHSKLPNSTFQSWGV